MKIEFDNDVVRTEMSKRQFIRLMDVLNMAIDGFHKLDDAISTGGDITLTEVRDIENEMLKACRQAGWFGGEK
jgi:hypothetical protein